MKNNGKKKQKALELNTDVQKGFNWRNTLILSFIVVYTFIFFSKVLDFEFVNWDDPDYITENVMIRDFSVEGFKKILTTPVIGMYNPVPFVIYAFEYKFWELDPKPYHWVSLILHLLATITLFNFMFRLTKRYEIASIVALLFAIHPMHVSVVAWACQNKTSLYLIFYFLALGFYLKYVQQNYKIRYLVYGALLFIMACLSKPEAVTLAPMLLLLDYYLSRKIERRLILEKIPFFAIALFFGVLTLLTHSAEGDTIFEVKKTYSLFNNFIVSNYSIAFYFIKLFYPKHLTTIYPYPDNNDLPFLYYVAIPIIPVILFLVWKSGKFRKEMIFGLLFFIIAISVLVRIVPSGFFGTANRYTYLSYTGLFFIIAQFVVYVIDNRFTWAPKIKPVLLTALCFFMIYCTYRTTRRIRVWENSITLFDDVIKKEPKLLMAYNQRAVAKANKGDYTGAIEDLTHAITIDSTYGDAYNNRGALKRDLKDYAGALKDVSKAIEIDPKNSSAYNNKANIEFDRGNLEQALSDYTSALRFNPKLGQAYFNRASVKLTQRDTTGAVEDLKRASRYGISQADTFINLFSTTVISNSTN